MTLKNIVWLASYPKSGNTWTRAFLMNYLLNQPEPIPINQLHRLGMGDSSANAYQMVSEGSFDPHDYMKSLELRPRVVRGIANNRADLNFVKTHNMNAVAFGHTLIDPTLTRGAVYIIRNPLDVVISYARHYGFTVDETIYATTQMGNSTVTDEKNVKQFLGNWSTHVTDWADERTFPVHVMRYEDMIADPAAAFRKLLDALRIPCDEDRLTRAVRHSSFDELSKQEAKTAFIERSDNNEKFFHTGRAGQWETDLTDEQIAQIKQDHGKVMKRFGYL